MHFLTEIFYACRAHQWGHPHPSIIFNRRPCVQIHLSLLSFQLRLAPPKPPLLFTGEKWFILQILIDMRRLRHVELYSMCRGAVLMPFGYFHVAKDITRTGKDVHLISYYSSWYLMVFAVDGHTRRECLHPVWDLEQRGSSVFIINGGCGLGQR